MKTIEIIKSTIESAQTIAIFGHEYVDGDCVGSMLGLGTLLESLGKKISYFTPYPVGQSLQFIPGWEKIQTEFDYNTYDLLIFVDFSPYSRIRKFTTGHEEYFDNNTLIIIDHHQGSHPEKANLVLKDIEVSSACERIYEHIQNRRPNAISPQIATYLYLGLTTDSGNFMYEKDSIRLFKNAAGLIERGADKKWVLDNIFYRNNIEMVQFANILTQRAKIYGNIMRTYYTDEEITKRNIDKDQADFGFYTLRTIYGPKIYIRLRQSGTMLKGSVRGNGNIDCATMCEKLFQGGGHHNAAGFGTSIGSDAEKTMNTTIEKIQNYIDNLSTI